uniref:Uncharacterized protein n=1 Tax=Timema poppense TaxID=170557 RepID=A0A7R9DWB4_TIMPO|nr:unnamed protein product [Timema poppensis]
MANLTRQSDGRGGRVSQTPLRHLGGCRQHGV